MGVHAISSSILALLAVGVTSQGPRIAPGLVSQDGVLSASPASIPAAATPAAAFPSAAPAVAPVAPVAPSVAPKLPLQSFNPMEATAQANELPARQPAVAQAMDDAISGDIAGLNAVASTAIAQAPSASGNFVEGFTAGFFQQVTLRAGEKECIAKNIHALTESAVGLITDVEQVIAQLVAHTPASELNVLGMISDAGQVVKIVTTAQTLVRGCVQGDVMVVMNATIRHLGSPQYVQGRLLANGIDIARVLSHAIPAWQRGDIKAVGSDFGTLLRKILLSRNSGPARMVLPEGVDQTQVYETVVNGVIAGLFVENTSVTITDAVDPSVHVFVDLHRCIAKEAPYLSAGVNALYLAIAQMSTNIEQWQLKQKGIEAGASLGLNSAAVEPPMNWMNQLSGLMTNIPTLLQRCGLDDNQREMMSVAIKNMNNVGMAFRIPGQSNRVAAGNLAAIKFDEAVTAWKVGNYRVFGELLGGLMRDLLLAVYPEKYHVDDGQLRKSIDGISHYTTSPFALFVGGFSAVMLLGLSVVRMARTNARAESFLQIDDDMEACHQGDTAVE